MIARIKNTARRISKRKVIVASLCILFTIAIGTMVADAAREVTVYVDGECREVSTYSDTAEGVLLSMGLPMDTPYDYTETDVGPEMHIGEKVKVTVACNGGVTTLYRRCNRVSAILKELNITLGRYDVVTPSPEAIFAADCEIVVKRVTYEVETKTKITKPETVYVDDNTIVKGAEVEKSAGKDGISTITYELKCVDGMVVESKPVIVNVDTQPEPRVVLRGTAAPVKKSAPLVTTSAHVNSKTVSPLSPETPLLLDENGAPVNYKRCITGKATAYTARPGAHTAIGDIAQVGYVAVNPREIPYGSKLYIRTTDGSYIYGYAKASDTGGFAKKGYIKTDLYFDTVAECYQFGCRTVEIYVL